MQQLKKFLLMLIDIFIINASLALAFLIRFDGIIPRMYLDKYGSLFITITLIKFPIFFIMGLYDRVWRYASINSLMQVVQSVIYSSVTFIFIMYLSKIRIHRGVIVMDLLLTLFILGFSRLLIRLVREFQLKYQCLL